MRLTIAFSSESEIRLPIHHNYLVQSLIYNALDSDFAEFLHDIGYEIGGRRLKLFVFSRLMGRYLMSGQEIRFESTVRLIVSSPYHDFCRYLLNALLARESVNLGGNILTVEEINLNTPEVAKEDLRLKLLSPVVAYSTLLKSDGSKYTCYFQPGETECTRLIAENLRRKYRVFHGQAPPAGDIQLRCLRQPRLHVVKYKGTIIKGYSGLLHLHGPTSLLQLALDAGLGAKNSMGFGCCEMIG